MARSPSKSEEDIAREVAEKAKPGWKAVSVTRSSAIPGVDAPTADFQGQDIDALKQKYLGVVKDAVPASAGATKNDDVHFVSMTPERASDTPIRSRKVLVSGRKVIGFQG